MRKTYRILADIIAIEVVLQAMFMVFAVSGLFKWIDDGNNLNQSVIDGWDEDPPTFQGAVGVFFHGINGQMIIPLIGLALLIVAFFAKVDRGVLFAAVIVASIVVQVLAGMYAGSAPWLGLVHGLNAFVLFSAAIMAARAAKPPVEAREAEAVTVAQ